MRAKDCRLCGGLSLLWHTLLLTRLMAAMANRLVEPTAGNKMLKQTYDLLHTGWTLCTTELQETRGMFVTFEPSFRPYNRYMA